MKDFRRLFVVRNGAVGGWTSSDRTSFVISVENDYLRVTVKTGRDMFAHEINTAFGKFLEEYERETGEKVEVAKREHRYRFCYRQGSSGCQDAFVEVDERGDGFPRRYFLMHQSCYGKCGGFSCWVYDFLDLCVAGGFFSVEDGFYHYPGEDIEYEMEAYKPRYIEYEDGWTNPWERPSEVVHLRTCREIPETDDSNSEERGEENEDIGNPEDCEGGQEVLHDRGQ